LIADLNQFADLNLTQCLICVISVSENRRTQQATAGKTETAGPPGANVQTNYSS